MDEMSELTARKEQRRFEHHPKLVWPRNKQWKTVPAVVAKIVKQAFADQPVKVEISITQADDLFREIRIENNFTDVDGGPVALTRALVFSSHSVKLPTQSSVEGRAHTGLAIALV